MTRKPIFTAGGLLFAFTAVSVLFVAWTQNLSIDKIKHNQKQLLIERLGELVADYDNNILADKIELKIELHGVLQTLNIYPAKHQNHTFAYLIEHTYPNGYNGNIRLLTGIDTSSKLLGVRVITHKETPGLGDKIETSKSNWMQQFKDLSLSNPSKNQWKVSKDGGIFDSFTGATITPRAIVTATYDVLTLFSNPCLLAKPSKNCLDK